MGVLSSFSRHWKEKLGRTKMVLGEKVREALASVLPITVIVLILCFTVAPVPTDTLLAFLVGAVLLIVGMGFFTLGADIAMTPIGERVGAAMTKSRKLWVVISVGLLIGVIVTVSEPDLQVLAAQVPGIPNAILVGAVAIGVGVFLVIALLRILFRIPLNQMLIVFYIMVFGLAIFIPEDFLAVAFDSGGVTTGPMTVPFIMALGVGVSSIRSDKNAQSDSFGLVALCSVGPILAVLILGFIYSGESADVSASTAESYLHTVELGGAYLHAIPEYMAEVAVALAPIVLFFLIFQVVSLKLRQLPLLRILAGILFTYVGLVLFLTGVNVGFSSLGVLLGRELGGGSFRWLLVPIAMLMGWFIVQAEPAVHVLTKQVEEISAGAVSEKAMHISLSLAISLAMGLAMVRILTGLHIFWLLIPGYLVSLALTFLVPQMFTAIAFDSGGVASGPMTATFMLPFAVGACEAVGGNILTDAFGLVSLVAMMPLITIQIMGAIYVYKTRRTAEVHVASFGDEEIIELWEVA